MTWVDLTKNWATSYKLLQSAFPYLEDDAMAFVKQDRSRFISYLAASHALTYQEAESSLEDYMARLDAPVEEDARATA